MSMILFLGWFGLACLGVSLALAALAWVYWCRCPACEPVRWRLTRPALDGLPILHPSSFDAEHDLLSRSDPLPPAVIIESFDPAGVLQRMRSQGRGQRATGGPVRAVGAVGNDGPEAFIPFKRHSEWKPKSTSVWRGDE